MEKPTVLRTKMSSADIFDDKPIRSLINGTIFTNVLLVAYEIGLFEVLQTKMMKQDLAKELNLPLKSVEALTSICITANLIREDNGYLIITEYASLFLTQDSHYYFGPILDLIIEQNEARSFKNIKKSIMEGHPQVYDGQGLFEQHDKDEALTACFTKAMHAKSIGPAQAWVQSVDLTHYHQFLDIGAGAGTHTIAACKRNNNLNGILFDTGNVCKIAKQYIQKEALTDRISLYTGDMWQDDYPVADVHFYGDILHDWPFEKGHFLIKKSFACLPEGGMIIIHEALLNDDKASPRNTVAYNMNMLLWTQGQQFSKQEIYHLLVSTGFSEVKIMCIFGDWHIVVGKKL